MIKFGSSIKFQRRALAKVLAVFVVVFMIFMEQAATANEKSNWCDLARTQTPNKVTGVVTV